MTNEKVLLPKDVVEGINHLRNTLGKSNSYILNKTENHFVKEFANESEANKDLLMKALVLGYDIEPEPIILKNEISEENAKKLVERFKSWGKPELFNYEDGKRDGVLFALLELGIEIKGINK